MLHLQHKMLTEVQLLYHFMHHNVYIYFLKKIYIFLDIQFHERKILCQIINLNMFYNTAWHHKTRLNFLMLLLANLAYL